jgi:hypothetical protein
MYILYYKLLPKSLADIAAVNAFLAVVGFRLWASLYSIIYYYLANINKIINK